MQLEPAAFERFKQYLHSTSGIVIGDSKQYLVKTRIEPIVKNTGLSSFSELVNKLQSDQGNQLRHLVIDAMTTNETLWFRDIHPFEYFKAYLATVKSKKLRVWCAACSSGQEPYSLSICVDEVYREGLISRNTSVEFVATDISTQILSVAKAAIYNRLALSRGLSTHRLKNYFQGDDDKKNLIQSVKNRVAFNEFNLQASFASLGRFDMIFCRNVLIYFSSEQKEDILKRFHRCLNPGGLLFLGCSESIPGLSSLYQMKHYKPGIVYIAR